MVSQGPTDWKIANSNTVVMIVLRAAIGVRMVRNKMVDGIEVKVLKEEGVVDRAVLDEIMTTIEVLNGEGGMVELTIRIGVIIIEVTSEVFQSDEIQGEIETVRIEDTITRDVAVVIAVVEVTASHEETSSPGGGVITIAVIPEGITILNVRVTVTASHEETENPGRRVTAVAVAVAVAVIPEGIAILSVRVTVTVR